MPKAYVVAPDGVRLKVTIQRFKGVEKPVTRHNITIINGVPIDNVETVGTETEMQWVDEAIVGPFASESREFDLADDQRVIIEAA